VYGEYFEFSSAIWGIPLSTGNTWEKSAKPDIQGSQAMWYRLKNFFQGFRTYAVLSPDLKVRRQVLRSLRQRPLLTPEEWFDLYGRSCKISFQVIQFAYRYLGTYSGLEFGRVLPGDRLDEDLCWTRVCWFDWYLALCDDFYQEFAIDLSDEVIEAPMTTIGALLGFLEDRYSPKKLP